jgi:hypothetical protein
MDNVKPRLYMKTMHEKEKDATRSPQELFGAGEKRERFPFSWLMKLIESFML